MVTPQEKGKVGILAKIPSHEPIFPQPEDLEGNFYPIIDSVFKSVITKKREEGKLSELTKVAIESGIHQEIERTVHWRDKHDIRRNIQAHMTQRDQKGVLVLYGHAWKDYMRETQDTHTETPSIPAEIVFALDDTLKDPMPDNTGGIRKSRFISATTSLEDIILGGLIENVGNIFEEISQWTEEDLTTVSDLPPVPPGWENARIEEF